jgi:hypothetical protein
VTILQIRAVAPLLVIALLSTLGCENDGSGSNTLLFNGGVGPSPTSSSLIITRPDATLPPSVSPTLGLPPTLNAPPNLIFSPPSTFVSRGAFVDPVAIRAQRVGAAFCPVQQPFIAPFNLVFVGDGTSDVFLSSVQMQFVDLAEIRAGTATLGRPELAVQFGTTAIPTFGTRAFPFAFPFGCNTQSIGTLTVVVVIADSRGREARAVKQLVVR